MSRAAMQFQHCGLKGVGELYEDCLILNHRDRIYGVADGATSVTPFRNEQGHTGGYLAANLLKDFFQDVPEDKRLSDVVLEANDALRQMMIEHHIDISCKSNLWCAAFAIFRIHKYYIEYVQAGDCMLFVKYNEGTVRNITHDQLAHLDAVSLQKLREAQLLGYTSQEEIDRYVLPAIRNNRMKSNTPEGYAVMNGEAEFALFLEQGSFNRCCLSAVYALTDGLFYPARNESMRADWNKTITFIDQKGLQDYAESLVKLEEADPHCEKYLRHKISDDKTGVVIHFHN